MKHNLIKHSLTMLTALTALLCATISAQAQDKKPNVVILMTDDTGWGDFGCYGGGAEPRPSDPEH